MPISEQTKVWLLDPAYPDVRAQALSLLEDMREDSPEVVAARQEAHQHGAIASVLAAMHPEGWWSEPGAGYSPKYYSSVWALIMLGQLGAVARMDERISIACQNQFSASWMAAGQFSASGTPAGTADCLQGNLCWAMTVLGVEDERLGQAYEWMARTVTGEGMAAVGERNEERRFFAGKCGPTFACGANNKVPCAWGGAKVMLAFSVLAANRRTALIERAIAQGVDFFLQTDPAKAEYPCGYGTRPSGNWWKFGFPVFYVTDLLQIVEALTQLGFGNDPRLANAVEIVRQKADPQGHWALEYDYRGKTWVDFGEKKTANRWVTLRALRVLKRIAAGE